MKVLQKGKQKAILFFANKLLFHEKNRNKIALMFWEKGIGKSFEETGKWRNQWNHTAAMDILNQLYKGGVTLWRDHNHYYLVSTTSHDLLYIGNIDDNTLGDTILRDLASHLHFIRFCIALGNHEHKVIGTYLHDPIYASLLIQHFYAGQQLAKKYRSEKKSS